MVLGAHRVNCTDATRYRQGKRCQQKRLGCIRHTPTDIRQLAEHAAGFAQPDFSVFDDRLTQILVNLPVANKSVVQIGCNNGREVLSVMTLGASTALGIDQSAEFLKQAEELKTVSGHPCEFLCANVYKLPVEIENKSLRDMLALP